MSLESDATLTDAISPTGSTSNMIHSYPPSPPTQFPTFLVQPPSPKSVHAKLGQLAPPPQQHNSTHIAQFLLAPHSTTHVPEQPEHAPSLFTRVFSAFKNHAPSHSYSFTLCPIPSTPSPSLPHHAPYSPKPLLAFHDRTPLLAVSSTSGILEINDAEERSLGVNPSFWIAIALTYLEFLGDREVRG